VDVCIATHVDHGGFAQVCDFTGRHAVSAAELRVKRRRTFLGHLNHRNIKASLTVADGVSGNQ
jgi:hypothetical protein